MQTHRKACNRVKIRIRLFESSVGAGAALYRILCRFERLAATSAVYLSSIAGSP
jgi:hypothetical protein